MLISLGLSRLESGLTRHTLQPSEVADFLDQAGPSDMGRLARDGMPTAIEGLHRRQLQRIEPSMEAVFEATNNGRTAGYLNGRTNGRTNGLTSGPRPIAHFDSLRAGGAAV